MTGLFNAIISLAVFVYLEAIVLYTPPALLQLQCKWRKVGVTFNKEYQQC